MTKDEVLAHGKKYSKSFNNGPWKDNQEAMCLKTVMKLLLSKYGILSIEMQRAIRFDQGVVNGDFTQMNSIEEIDAAEVDYVDNPDGGVILEPVTEEVKVSDDLFDENKKEKGADK